MEGAGKWSIEVKGRRKLFLSNEFHVSYVLLGSSEMLIERNGER